MHCLFATGVTVGCFVDRFALALLMYRALSADRAFYYIFFILPMADRADRPIAYNVRDDPCIEWSPQRHSKHRHRDPCRGAVPLQAGSFAPETSIGPHGNLETGTPFSFINP